MQFNCSVCTGRCVDFLGALASLGSMLESQWVGGVFLNFVNLCSTLLQIASVVPLVVKVGSQGYYSRLVIKVGSQGCYSRLVVNVGSQGW